MTVATRPGTIPDTHRDLFERPVLASFATVMPDGQPQVTPVWCDYDGSYVRINTAIGRPKYRNMRANPKVTLLLVDPDNQFRYLEVRGVVERFEERGADEHIDALAKKYLGVDVYPNHTPSERRVICYIRPVHVTKMG
jgi:PPOX class probable F420-dependent enzyme